ncbi:MAG TPA: cytochrome P450 [Kineosporiaceae bacterium]
MRESTVAEASTREPVCTHLPATSWRTEPLPRPSGGLRPGRVRRWVIRHGLPRLLLRVMTWAGSLVGSLLFDRGNQEQLYDLHRRIRAKGRLVGGVVALATGHHRTTVELLRDPTYHAGATSSRVASCAMRHGVAPDAVGPLDAPSLLVVDPPEHPRYRRLVNKVFTARAVAAMGPDIARIADGLLDAFPGTGVVDLVPAYAKRLPVAVIAHLMGIPESMLDQFLSWSDRAAPALDLGLPYREYLVADQALHETNRWLREHFQRVRNGNGDDLLSRLVRIVDDDDQFTDDELLATVQLLLAAGFVTIVDMIANGAVLLLRHPRQLAELRADPSGWPNAVEEILRYESPVQLTARFATERATLAGRELRRGRAIVAILGAANRDPEVFEDADVFDIRRPNARDHVAFSRGLHHCLGSGLARLEGEIGFRALFERYPDMTLLGGPVRRPGAVLRGYSSVPVRLAAGVR